MTWFKAPSPSWIRALQKKHPGAKLVYGIPHPATLEGVSLVIDASHMDAKYSEIYNTKAGLEIGASVTLAEMRQHLVEVLYLSL